MRKQVSDAACRVRGQLFEHVAHVGIRVMAIQPRGVDQAHDCCGALAGAQAPEPRVFLICFSAPYYSD